LEYNIKIILKEKRQSDVLWTFGLGYIPVRDFIYIAMNPVPGDSSL
jgi:hypothetical protein